MSQKKHIERNTVQETLVIPLYSRKLCSDIYGDYFSDDSAVALVDSLDYDFGDYSKRSKNLVERFGSLEVATRQKAFMYEAELYLKKHPKAAIVNLGCGLDSTAENLDNETCKIYNIDMPDVIEIRNELIKPYDRVKNIKADLNDLSWFDEIDDSDGAFFFASGVFYYFTLAQMQNLVNAMAKRFKGGELVFDIAGKRAVKMAVKTWIKSIGIENVGTSFYVGDIKKDINPWLKNGVATSRDYMLGYFDLKEKSIPAYFRVIAKIADKVMKMKIVKISFKA